MRRMILEAEKGEHIDETARRAIAAGCEAIIHNWKIYNVVVSLKEIGRVIERGEEEGAK